MLITEPDSVPAPILGALDRLSPQRLRILGGTEAVTPNVEAILNEHYLTWVFG